MMTELVIRLSAFSMKSDILDVKRCILEVSKISAALSFTHSILPSLLQNTTASGRAFSTSIELVLNNIFFYIHVYIFPYKCIPILSQD